MSNPTTLLSTPNSTPIALTAALLREFSGSDSNLGKILYAEALRQWLAASTWSSPTLEAAPTPSVKCKHGLREAWCAICKAPNDCVDSRGTAPVYKDKAQVICKTKNQQFARCLECGEQFVDAEDKPTLSQFEFCGETPLTNGPCKKVWLGKHQPACLIRSVRFHTVTPEDVAWAKREPLAGGVRRLPGLRDGSLLRLRKKCEACQRHVAAQHNSVRCAAKLLATQQSAAMKREAQRQHLQGDLAQSRFEEKNIVFVGGGVSLEAIEGFNNSPRPNHSDQREKDLMRWAQQRSRIGVAVGATCLRCTTPITKRNGTKYCSDNCRKRHHESTQGEN